MADNSLLKDFRAQVRSRFAEDSDAMSYSDWIVKNTHLRKVPFQFKGFEFQRQIINDMHHNLAVIKCSQIGLTEVQLRKFAAFLGRNVAVNGIFTLPNDDMYRRVSTTRFAPLVNSERVFNLGVDKPIRRMDLYQINQSFGYFTGNKESDATSINADLLFHDEVDLSDQEMLGLFQSRLQGSDYRITQQFSTPTFEGFGIDAAYAASDQHEYMVRCVHCGHHNIPEFNPNFIDIPGLSSDLNDLVDIDAQMATKLDLDNAKVICESCHEPLQMGDPSLWNWVARHPGRRARGYRVSPFCVPRLTVPYIIDQLLQYKQKDAIRRFYNTVLGRPYNDSTARLSETDIIRIMDSEAKSPDHKGHPVVLGIDVGITCHVVVMRVDTTPPVICDWRQVLADNLIDEVNSLKEEYNVIGGCMDRDPYTPTANEIRDMTHGAIMPVEYAKTPNAQPISIQKDELDNITHIRANRTIMIDALVAAIRKGRVRFTGFGQYKTLIITHLRDMVRDESADTPATWRKLQGNDHFFHAATYAMFASRVGNALYYKSDADTRIMAMDDIIITMKNAPEISMKRRRSEAISLGQII